MRVWQIVVPGLLGLVLTGCRSDPEIAYLQRDNLNKQKKIEQLQYRVEELEEALNGGAPTEPTVKPRHAADRNAARAPHDRWRPIRPGPRPPRSAFPSSGTNHLPARDPRPGILHISPCMEVTPGEVPDRLKISQR